LSLVHNRPESFADTPETAKGMFGLKFSSVFFSALFAFVPLAAHSEVTTEVFASAPTKANP
jgi:hypothetical protein